MVLRVINNFGLDFKHFIEKEGVVTRIVDLVQTAESELLRRDAIMTLKNLFHESSNQQKSNLRKHMTDEFLMTILRE